MGGWGLGAKNPKPSHWGFVPGAPLQMAAGNDVVVGWGVGDEVVVVVLVSNRMRRGWGIWGPNKPQNHAQRLGLGLSGGWCGQVASCGVTGSPLVIK